MFVVIITRCTQIHRVGRKAKILNVKARGTNIEHRAFSQLTTDVRGSIHCCRKECRLFSETSLLISYVKCRHDTARSDEPLQVCS